MFLQALFVLIDRGVELLVPLEGSCKHQTQGGAIRIGLESALKNLDRVLDFVLVGIEISQRLVGEGIVRLGLNGEFEILDRFVGSAGADVSRAHEDARVDIRGIRLQFCVQESDCLFALPGADKRLDQQDHGANLGRSGVGRPLESRNAVVRLFLSAQGGAEDLVGEIVRVRPVHAWTGRRIARRTNPAVAA